jgi:hypothetical protein
MKSLDDIQLQDLESFGLQELRDYWAGYYGIQVPATMSRELLHLSIGYKLQEVMFGGLSRRTQLQLSSTRFDAESRNVTKTSLPRPTHKSGTKLIREWRGKVHEVLVLDDGQFACGGKTYRSLTTIAKQITGTHQSGPRFFGIKVVEVTEGAGRDSRG